MIRVNLLVIHLLITGSASSGPTSIIGRRFVPWPAVTTTGAKGHDGVPSPDLTLPPKQIAPSAIVAASSESTDPKEATDKYNTAMLAVTTPTAMRPTNHNRSITYSLISMHHAMLRAAADAISAFGFASSLSVGLLTAKTHFRQLKPTIEAMKLYLEDTGISQEIGKGFTSKLFDNMVILWRIQKEYRDNNDLRDLAAKRNPGQLPNMEEASR